MVLLFTRQSSTHNCRKEFNKKVRKTIYYCLSDKPRHFGFLWLIKKIICRWIDNENNHWLQPYNDNRLTLVSYFHSHQGELSGLMWDLQQNEWQLMVPGGAILQQYVVRCWQRWGPNSRQPSYFTGCCWSPFIFVYTIKKHHSSHVYYREWIPMAAWKSNTKSEMVFFC